MQDTPELPTVSAISCRSCPRNVQRTNPAQPQRGAALLISLTILLVMALIGSSALQSTVLDERMTGNQKLIAESLSAAETGVRDGLNRLLSGMVSDVGREADPDWRIEDLTTPDLPTGITNRFLIRHKVLGGQVVSASAGRPLYTIYSIGDSHGVSRNVEVTLSLVFNGAFDSALTGCEGVRLAANARTSSYRSSGLPADGQRGDIRTVDPNAPITLRSNADIKGSLNATGNISMSPHAQVHVDAKSSGNIALENNASVDGNSVATGAIDAVGRADIGGATIANTGKPVVPVQDCDPLHVADLFTKARSMNFNNHPDNRDGDNYSLGHNSADTFFGGNYRFGDFTIQQNAQVTIEGNVVFLVDGGFAQLGNTNITLTPNSTFTLYAAGPVEMSSNTSINQNGLPAGFMLYSNARSDSESDVKIALNSNSGFYGVVYAPFATIESRSNSEIHGAMRGKYIDMASNAEFIYDEDLTGLGPRGKPEDLNVVYWSE